MDKILKEDKPPGLPVEQPMRFELVINLKLPAGFIRHVGGLPEKLEGLPRPPRVHDVR